MLSAKKQVDSLSVWFNIHFLGVAKLQDLIAQGRTMKVEKEKALIEANSKLEALEAVLKGLEDTKNSEEKLEKV